MAVQITSFWTLQREGGFVKLRKYRVRTRLVEDDAMHEGCSISQHHELPLEALPAFMLEHDIQEFSDEESAQFLLSL